MKRKPNTGSPPSGNRETRQERQRQDALRDLERVSEQADTIGASALKRTAERTKDHFLGADAAGGDAAEIWGRRIGRLLSLIFLAGLVWYLAKTYL